MRRKHIRNRSSEVWKKPIHKIFTSNSLCLESLLVEHLPIKGISSSISSEQNGHFQSNWLILWYLPFSQYNLHRRKEEKTRSSLNSFMKNRSFPVTARFMQKLSRNWKSQHDKVFPQLPINYHWVSFKDVENISIKTIVTFHRMSFIRNLSRFKGLKVF